MEEDAFSLGEKKRRLSIDQVQRLEKNFEEENKLEPERKERIAEETGLHPRQVAVWFQNRRARGKTKQLEKDYEVLKGHYHSLKLDYGNLQHERQLLTSKLKELRVKVREESKEEEQTISLAEQMVPICHNGWYSSSCSGSGLTEPCRFGNYPQKEINMVDLEELSNLNSLEYDPNLQW